MTINGSVTSCLLRLQVRLNLLQSSGTNPEAGEALWVRSAFARAGVQSSSIDLERRVAGFCLQAVQSPHDH